MIASNLYQPAWWFATHPQRVILFCIHLRPYRTNATQEGNLLRFFANIFETTIQTKLFIWFTMVHYTKNMQHSLYSIYSIDLYTYHSISSNILNVWYPQSTTSSVQHQHRWWGRWMYLFECRGRWVVPMAMTFLQP